MRPLKKIPSLEQFLYRKQVLQLFRDIVRSCYGAPTAVMTRELVDHAKSEFAVVHKVVDKSQRSWLLQTGRKQAKGVCQSLGLTWRGRD